MNNPFHSIANGIKNVVAVGLLLIAASPLMAMDVDLSGRSAEDTKRDSTSKPAQIINFVGVKSGDKVLDLLGGGGYYTIFVFLNLGPGYRCLKLSTLF